MAAIDQPSRRLELHAFGFAKEQKSAPLIFITASGTRDGRSGPGGFFTSSAVKSRLAQLLDLRVSTLKFYAQADLEHFLIQGRLRAALAILLDSKLNADELYDATHPPILAEACQWQSEVGANTPVLGRQLLQRLRANWLVEDDALANLSTLIKAAATVMDPTLKLGFACAAKMVRCARCFAWFPIPGSRKPPAGNQTCSRCRGDPEGMRVIARMALALRFGGDEERETLRARLKRAIKRGHAEAVRAIALAERKARTWSHAELDLAIRCRRAGILALVLSCCSPEAVASCLKSTENHAEASNLFGGQLERALFFQDLRGRIKESHNFLTESMVSEEVQLGALVASSHKLPTPARLTIREFLSLDSCEQLADMLAGIDGLEVKVNW